MSGVSTWLVGSNSISSAWSKFKRWNRRQMRESAHFRRQSVDYMQWNRFCAWICPKHTNAHEWSRQVLVCTVQRAGKRSIRHRVANLMEKGTVPGQKRRPSASYRDRPTEYLNIRSHFASMFANVCRRENTCTCTGFHGTCLAQWFT